MKGASRGLEGGLRRASRGLQALLTFVPPGEGPFKPPLKGTFEGGGSDPAHFGNPAIYNRDLPFGVAQRRDGRDQYQLDRRLLRGDASGT